MTTPEQRARQTIDALLQAAGWQVQDRDELNLSAARGVAVREFPLKTGFADYLLFVDRRSIGAVEAKAEGRLSVTGEIAESVEANLTRAERLRQAILRRAFEGKLVGRDAGATQRAPSDKVKDGAADERRG